MEKEENGIKKSDYYTPRDIHIEYGAEIRRWPLVFHIKQWHWWDMDKIKYAISFEIVWEWLLNKEIIFNTMYPTVDDAIDYIKNDFIPYIKAWAKK